MNPLIVDPHNYDRKIAYEQAKKQCQEFLGSNKLREPGQWATEMPMKKYQRNFGLYNHSRGGSVCVNLKKSRPPVKTPGFQWSYTGYKSDLTAPGILAHEVGHHIDAVFLKELSRDDRRSTWATWDRIRRNEPRVSSYEPNDSEAFAESMKLFILNPDLLRTGRPLRYKFLTKALQLVPVHDLSWQQILVNAHPKLHAAARKWMVR
mgnify:CR=1 FL=1